jgi:hypothetical protein
VRPRPDRPSASSLAAALLIAASLLAVGPARAAHAQGAQAGADQGETPEVAKALELEESRHFREALPIFKAAMATRPTPTVVLGL